ncbi:MAG TPA: hypothetical protein VGD84_16335 [Pseudonocardiaceae bacterium]
MPITKPSTARNAANNSYWSLLTLARSQRGLDVRRTVDLAAVVTDVLATYGCGPVVRTRPALTFGDRRLVERLVANLADNAVRHNVPVDGSRWTPTR